MLGALMAAMLSPELRTARFVIEGHTEAGAPAAQSLRLSRERAEQVRLYLVTLGVQAERLQVVGRGATVPANPRDPRAAENRRVRIVAMP
jgi:outer membrane protein OmpA-like peptidoglycan-associated protein